jgi:ABC-type protease/lipase transport system fused ATPase/permease subunit
VRGDLVSALLADLRPLPKPFAGLSLFINLLFLTPAIFTLQVFDRATSSALSTSALDSSLVIVTIPIAVMARTMFPV